MTRGHGLRRVHPFRNAQAKFPAPVLALIVVSALTACTVTAGRDFARPASGSLVIGETTEGEVLARYGKPEATGTEERAGQTIDMLVYSYASNEEALVGGTTPSRVLACHFVDRSLVGYEFISSYPNDHTSFDPSKREDIKVGESSREDVIDVMGPPNGELARPLVDSPAERALVYSYAHTQVSVGGFPEVELHQGRTLLLVLLDADGVVQDIRYSASQT